MFDSLRPKEQTQYMYTGLAVDSLLTLMCKRIIHHPMSTAAPIE